MSADAAAIDAGFRKKPSGRDHPNKPDNSNSKTTARAPTQQHHATMNHLLSGTVRTGKA